MLEYFLINILWIIGFIYLNRKLRNGLHILQLEHYKIKEYKNWIRKHLNKVCNIKELLAVLCTANGGFLKGKALKRWVQGGSASLPRPSPLTRSPLPPRQAQRLRGLRTVHPSFPAPRGSPHQSAGLWRYLRR